MFTFPLEAEDINCLNDIGILIDEIENLNDLRLCNDIADLVHMEGVETVLPVEPQLEIKEISHHVRWLQIDFLEICLAASTKERWL